jgi:hypothetical protein
MISNSYAGEHQIELPVLGFTGIVDLCLQGSGRVGMEAAVCMAFMAIATASGPSVGIHPHCKAGTVCLNACCAHGLCQEAL